MTQVHKRKSWATNDFTAQVWVNGIIWTTLRRPTEPEPVPAGGELVPYSDELLREVLLYNQLQAFAVEAYGDGLKPVLGDSFYTSISSESHRTEILLEELHWLLLPRVGPNFMVIGDAMFRKYYDRPKDSPLKNPRTVQTLELWTPTLLIRDDIVKTLFEAGYVPLPDNPDDPGYRFQKNTFGLIHNICVKGVLWENSKNWSTEIERNMWDRLETSGPNALPTFTFTDQFILAMRNLTINRLFHRAVDLLDLVTLVEQGNKEGSSRNTLDWTVLESMKNQFQKPFWIWMGIMALELYEKKSDSRLSLPNWARTGVANYRDGFWDTFIESRMNWSNPDTRLPDYSRVYVKLSQGK